MKHYLYNEINVWDSGKLFMTNCSHEHAEWIAPGNLMEQNFDSHLRINVTALWSFPICLYREAMHLQCFRPRATWWAGLRARKCDDLYQIRWKEKHGSLLALCGSTMLYSCTMWAFRTLFFLLSVSARLLQPKIKEYVYNVINAFEA